LASAAAIEVGARNTHDALDRRHRHRVGALAQTHENGLGDGQRERQADDERRADAVPRVDRERAAELLDLVVHDVHADAAAGQLGHGLGGRESGFQDEAVEVAIGQLHVGLEDAAFDRLAPDRVTIQAAAIVGHAQHDFRRLAAHLDADRAVERLVRDQPLFRRFDTVRERVAHHVLEWRLHALEQVAVHFALCAFDLQLGAFAEFLCGLAQRAPQTRHERVERHHARAHEAFLQIGRHTRLLQQQRFRLTREVVEQALNRGQVRYRLGQCARQLLQLAEAVELERIEHRFGRFGFALVARQDLRFGFEFELAQLVAQTADGGFEFDQVEAERRNLLLET